MRDMPEVNSHAFPPVMIASPSSSPSPVSPKPNRPTDVSIETISDGELPEDQEEGEISEELSDISDGDLDVSKTTVASAHNDNVDSPMEDGKSVPAPEDPNPLYRPGRYYKGRVRAPPGQVPEGVSPGHSTAPDSDLSLVSPAGQQEDEDFNEDELYLRLIALRSMAPDLKDEDLNKEEETDNSAMVNEMEELLEEAELAADEAEEQREDQKTEEEEEEITYIGNQFTEEVQYIETRNAAADNGDSNSNVPDLKTLVKKLKKSLERQKKLTADVYSPTQSPIRIDDASPCDSPLYVPVSPEPYEEDSTPVYTTCCDIPTPASSPIKADKSSWTIPLSTPSSPNISSDQAKASPPRPRIIPIERLMSSPRDSPSATNLQEMLTRCVDQVRSTPFGSRLASNEPLPPGDEDAFDASQEPIDMELGSENEAEIQFFKEQKEQLYGELFPPSVWQFGPPPPPPPPVPAEVKPTDKYTDEIDTFLARTSSPSQKVVNEEEYENKVEQFLQTMVQSNRTSKHRKRRSRSGSSSDEGSRDKRHTRRRFRRRKKSEVKAPPPPRISGVKEVSEDEEEMRALLLKSMEEKKRSKPSTPVRQESPKVQSVESPKPAVQDVESPSAVQVVESPEAAVQVEESPKPAVQVVQSPKPAVLDVEDSEDSKVAKAVVERTAPVDSSSHQKPPTEVPDVSKSVPPVLKLPIVEPSPTIVAVPSLPKPKTLQNAVLQGQATKTLKLVPAKKNAQTIAERATTVQKKQASKRTGPALIPSRSSTLPLNKKAKLSPHHRRMLANSSRKGSPILSNMSSASSNPNHPLIANHFPNLTKPFLIRLGEGDSSDENDDPKPTVPKSVEAPFTPDFNGKLDMFMTEMRLQDSLNSRDQKRTPTKKQAVMKKKRTPPPKPARKNLPPTKRDPATFRKGLPSGKTPPQKVSRGGTGVIISSAAKVEVMKKDYEHMLPASQREEYRKLKELLAKKMMQKLNKQKQKSAKPVAEEEDPEKLREMLLLTMKKKTVVSVTKPIGNGTNPVEIVNAEHAKTVQVKASQLKKAATKDVKVQSKLSPAKKPEVRKVQSAQTRGKKLEGKNVEQKLIEPAANNVQLETPEPKVMKGQQKKLEPAVKSVQQKIPEPKKVQPNSSQLKSPETADKKAHQKPSLLKKPEAKKGIQSPKREDSSRVPMRRTRSQTRTEHRKEGDKVTLNKTLKVELSKRGRNVKVNSNQKKVDERPKQPIPVQAKKNERPPVSPLKELPNVSKEQKENLQVAEKNVLKVRSELTSDLYKLSAQFSQLKKTTETVSRAELFIVDLRNQLIEMETLLGREKTKLDQLKSVVSSTHNQVSVRRTLMQQVEVECHEKGKSVFGEKYVPPQEGAKKIQEKLAAIASNAKQLRPADPSPVSSAGQLSSSLAHLRDEKHTEIDPHKTLCRFDLQGKCNDDTCPFQHHVAN